VAGHDALRNTAKSNALLYFAAMRTIRRQAFMAVLIVFVTACGGDAKAPRTPRASLLLVTPKPPGSMVIDTSGTAEAERLTLVAPMSGDAVADFYRWILPRSGWLLKSDRSAEGVIDLYADGGPLKTSSIWIHIERQDSLSARYTLIANTPRATLDSIERAAERRRAQGSTRDTVTP